MKPRRAWKFWPTILAACFLVLTEAVFGVLSDWFHAASRLAYDASVRVDRWSRK